MSIQAFLRKIAGRAGKASRSHKGANSHIHTKANKRAASKAVRRCQEAELTNQSLEREADALVHRFFGHHTPYEHYDRTFYEDHHLDIPDGCNQLGEADENE